MEILIYSIIAFLMLSFYLCVFSLDRRRIKNHIVFWIVFHFAAACVFSLHDKRIETIPFFMLTLSTIYYFVTYFFSVKKVLAELRKEQIVDCMKKRVVKNLSKHLCGVCSVLLILNLVIVIRNQELEENINRVYFGMLSLVSYVQILINYTQLKKMKN